MGRIRNLYILIGFLICLLPFDSIADEKKIRGIIDQIDLISKDIKTLEKAVYKNSGLSNFQSNNLNEDVMAKHLLKLNEIEDQFRELTNRFEEINFKIDKLSTRVSKIQSDTQLRFSDIENKDVGSKEKKKKKITSLPGTSKPSDFGASPGYSNNEEKEQKINSIESTATIITEKANSQDSLLPNKSPPEQYEFALSFMKVGDYETAEFALKEFIDKNKDNDLAGSAQYWYGETFRIRQLYSDAASAYLDGYQNYPKSKKAPENLLKLGITMVQLGEKDQGCEMMKGIKKQYPKASKSVLEKAQFERKKFKCA